MKKLLLLLIGASFALCCLAGVLSGSIPRERAPTRAPAPTATPAKLSYSGEGPGTIDLQSPTGAITYLAAHAGGGNFIVRLVGQDTNELLANCIGVCSDDGSIPVLAGKYLVEIEASGQWTLEMVFTQ